MFTYQACGPKKKTYVFRSLGGSRPPQTPWVGGLPPPNTPAGDLGGGNPPTRGVWGAGAPQGAKNIIKYRPKASYVLFRIIEQPKL